MHGRTAKHSGDRDRSSRGMEAAQREHGEGGGRDGDRSGSGRASNPMRAGNTHRSRNKIACHERPRMRQRAVAYRKEQESRCAQGRNHERNIRTRTEDEVRRGARGCDAEKCAEVSPKPLLPILYSRRRRKCAEPFDQCGPKHTFCGRSIQTADCRVARAVSSCTRLGVMTGMKAASRQRRAKPRPAWVR